MMTNAELLGVVLERLQPLPVTSRGMFGGKSLYFDGRFFGIIFDGVLYFRTDDETRADYTSRGMPALQPKYRPRGRRPLTGIPRCRRRYSRSPPLLRKWAQRVAAVRRYGRSWAAKARLLSIRVWLG